MYVCGWWIHIRVWVLQGVCVVDTHTCVGASRCVWWIHIRVWVLQGVCGGYTYVCGCFKVCVVDTHTYVGASRYFTYVLKVLQDTCGWVHIRMWVLQGVSVCTHTCVGVKGFKVSCRTTCLYVLTRVHYCDTRPK